MPTNNEDFAHTSNRSYRCKAYLFVIFARSSAVATSTQGERYEYLFWECDVRDVDFAFFIPGQRRYEQGRIARASEKVDRKRNEEGGGEAGENVDGRRSITRQ
jgi:hypothetical protein